MPRRKGSPKTGGRRKGTPNKVTAATKAAVADLFHAVLLGASTEVQQWAKKNPGQIMAVITNYVSKGGAS